MVEMGRPAPNHHEVAGHPRLGLSGEGRVRILRSCRQGGPLLRRPVGGARYPERPIPGQGIQPCVNRVRVAWNRQAHPDCGCGWPRDHATVPVPWAACAYCMLRYELMVELWDESDTRDVIRLSN